MAVATRLNSVTYGGVAFGVGTSYPIHDAILTTHSYPGLTLEFTVVFRAATEAALYTLEDALITAIRKPNTTLVVTRNSQNFINTSHSSNTGMNSRGTATELLSHRSNLSRAYRIRIELMYPADETGKNARRDSSWTVTTDAGGIRTISVVAEYTASGASSAYTQATTNFPTYVAAIEAIVDNTATWDTTDQAEYTLDDEVKVCQARINSRELIFAQSSSGTDDASVDGIQFTIRVFREAQPMLAGSGAKPLAISEVTFSAPVRSGQTTDLEGYVTGTIKPYLLTLVNDEVEVDGSPIEAGWEYAVDPVNNRVEGRAQFRHAVTNLIFASLRSIQSEDYGKALVPLVGGVFDRDLHQGPATLRKTLLYRAIEVGAGTNVTTKAFDAAMRASQAAGYVLIADTYDTSVEELENDEGNARLEYTILEIAATLEYANFKPAETGGSEASSGSGGTFSRGGGDSSRGTPTAVETSPPPPDSGLASGSSDAHAKAQAVFDRLRSQGL